MQTRSKTDHPHALPLPGLPDSDSDDEDDEVWVEGSASSVLHDEAKGVDLSGQLVGKTVGIHKSVPEAERERLSEWWVQYGAQVTTDTKLWRKNDTLFDFLVVSAPDGTNLFKEHKKGTPPLTSLPFLSFNLPPIPLPAHLFSSSFPYTPMPILQRTASPPQHNSWRSPNRVTPWSWFWYRWKTKSRRK